MLHTTDRSSRVVVPSFQFQGRTPYYTGMRSVRCETGFIRSSCGIAQQRRLRHTYTGLSLRYLLDTKRRGTLCILAKSPQIGEFLWPLIAVIASVRSNNTKSACTWRSSLSPQIPKQPSFPTLYAM